VLMSAWVAFAAETPGADWKAGVASVTITPTENVWLAGYANRTNGATGKINELHAKALALEDSGGQRFVLVTLDLVAVPRALRDWLATEVAQRYHLPPEVLLINSSHTHSGPEFRSFKLRFYQLNDAWIQKAEHYNDYLQRTLADLVGSAITNLAPARLAYSKDTAGFAMNRRLKTKNGYSNAPNP